MESRHGCGMMGAPIGRTVSSPRHFMSILAVCPFCKQGKVRAPITAIGLSATCPSCYNCFTIVESKEKTQSSQKTVQGVATALRPPVAAPARPAVSDPTPLPAGINDEDLPDIEMSAPPLRDEPKPVTVTISTFATPEEPDGESVFSLAMIAHILAGIALFVSQITRYGRYATVGLAMIGVLLAVLALMTAARRKLWPLLAAAANVLAILLVTLLPGWLALDSWWPPKNEDNTGITKVRPLDGGAIATLEGGWVDLSKGVWQRDDVLVKISAIWVGKVQIKGPKDALDSSKEKVLVVGMQISNVGVMRRINYRSWQGPLPPECVPPQVTDSTGKVHQAKKFPDGWAMPFHAQDGTVLPGAQAHDD